MSKDLNWLGLNCLPTAEEAFERLAAAAAGIREYYWLISRMKGQR